MPAAVTFKRRLGTLIYLILFTNSASWVFFYAVYTHLRLRLPGFASSPNFWFFCVWYPVTLGGMSLLASRDTLTRIKLFLSGYLAIGLLHNCVWLALYRALGHSGPAWAADLIPGGYPAPFFSVIEPWPFMVVFSIVFFAAGVLSVWSREPRAIAPAAACMLFLIVNHFGGCPWSQTACLLLIAAAAAFAWKPVSSELHRHRFGWVHEFHPMLGGFAFVLSVCVFCFATAHTWTATGVMFADVNLYGITYPIVIITAGYMMLGDYRPTGNIFERVKLFIIFWLFEALFYDWSWWAAYILYGEPFKWSDPFYVDVLVPYTTMLSFLIVAALNALVGVYTFLFVKSHRSLAPVLLYFLVLAAILFHKMFLGYSNWTFAAVTYAAAAAIYIVIVFSQRKNEERTTD